MLFEKVKEEHILQAIKDYEEKGIPNGFGPSSTYDVVYEAKRYPPPSIMSYAYLNAEGKEVEPHFKVGENSECFNTFERNGFTIERKKRNEKLYKLKQQFLDYWPLEKLQNMTLEEYTDTNRENSFCYWLEHITRDLGSIVGGSSYKFGIYKMGIGSKTESATNRDNDGVYAWHTKYGLTPNEAFNSIKKLIIDIATLAKNDEINQIESIDLGDAYKWKIAFLYSDYKVLNLFKKPWLVNAAYGLGVGDDNLKMSELNQLILSQKPEITNFFSFSKELWSMYGDIQTDDLTVISNFEKYLKKFYKKKNGETLSNGSIGGYISGIKKIAKDLSKRELLTNATLFSINEIEILNKLNTNYFNIKEISEENKKGRNRLENSFSRFVDFKKHEVKSIINKNTKGWMSNTKELEKKLRKQFKNIWRCADSNKWHILKSHNLLTFDWLDNTTNYKSINIKKDLESGMRSIEPWVNQMKVGDLVFIMGKNQYNGIAVIESDYDFNNHKIDMGESGLKPAIKVNYIHKLDLPIEHQLKTHNNPTTFASLDKYSFNLKSTLDMLKSKVPKAYEELLNLVASNSEVINTENDNFLNINTTNQILYGPPGTGKTYYLKDQLFDRYTSRQTSISKEQHFETVVGGCSWWQVIAIALLDLKNAKVTNIFEHEWVQKKASLSNSKTIRPTLWGQLQSHTINECKHVNVSSRQQPLLFNKTEDSYWEILEDEVKELVPELYDLKDSVENYSPDPDTIIKNYDFVTFHQSFAYEDFIEGIKPISPEEGEEAKDLGYAIEDGVFKKLCLKAKNDPNNRYAIFIDEINRGNVSAIFGELITLIEIDKRKDAENEISIKLPYSKTAFSVPSNIDIYGTMNTADRSVEALDTALRRRFEFKEMMPDYTVIENEEVVEIKLSEVLETINQRIELLIDRDHTIGHSYFVKVTSTEKLANAFNNKIVPLLQEYFYGDYGKIGLVLGSGFVDINKNDKVYFANFEYENANDFKIASYKLKQVDEDTVIDAVLELLGKKETLQ
jgi:5-methylcytosine-specific restriction endonuclease McrBC GTP-binding regulatory subunit McrB